MPSYRLFHRGPAENQKREVRIAPGATSSISGFTALGAAFDHDLTDKRALFTYVRDQLYHIGVYNTQDLIIAYSADTVVAPNAHIWESEVWVQEGNTADIRVYDIPAALTSPTITVDSSDDEVVTVAESGGVVTITTVSVGQATVTITILGEDHTILVHVTEDPGAVEEDEEEDPEDP